MWSSVKTSIIKKMKLNPSNETPLAGFKCVLQKWIKSGTLEKNGVKEILLDSHYKFD
jgi:hypothetical protein